MKEDGIVKIDKQLIMLLSKDGRMPAKALARKLDVSAPTINSRMKGLKKQGIHKFAGLVDTFKAKDMLVAIIAIGVDDVSKMAKIIDQLMEFEQVHWAVSVTGR